MIFPLAGLLLGAVIGALTARKRGGNALDMAQYAAGYGIALAVLALILSLLLVRLA
jgi:hypothetical protein